MPYNPDDHHGPTDNTEQMLHAMTISAQQGDPEAQFVLGNVYQLGVMGVPTNLKKAVSWYKKAANQGYADAQLNLGICYLVGRGVKEDLVEAVRLFLEAEKNGSEEAKEMLKMILEGSQKEG